MSDVNLSISTELVEPIIRAKMQAAIAAALGDDPTSLIDAIVSEAMGRKVNSEGEVSQYSSSNTYSYVEVLCNRAIRAAADDAIQAWIKDNHTKLREGIERQLNRQSGKMTRAFVDGLLDSIKASWRFKVDVNVDSDD